MSAAATSMTSGTALRPGAAVAVGERGERRAEAAHRAARAARPARRTPRGAEVHERLVEVVTAPWRHQRLGQRPHARLAAQAPEAPRAEEHAAEHAPDVGVEHRRAAAEGERA